MISIGAFDAKTHLSKLLEQVSSGEEIIITKHGVPVARLSPVKPANHIPIRDIIQDFKRSREKATLGGLSITELKNEGRR